MIRKHENTFSLKAAMLALVVHVFLIGILLFSFNWNNAHTEFNVTEVELWDQLPKTRVAPPIKVVPEPLPEPVPEPTPKPVPELTPEPVPEPEPETPKVDIELENKKKAEEEKKKLALKKKKIAQEKKRIAEKKRKKALEKIKRVAREEELQKEKLRKEQEDLKRIQEALLNEDNNVESQKQASAAQTSLINEYTNKIQAKIRGNVNKTLCGDGNPELRFKIGLLPTGEYRSSPALTKSSGIAACDEAVERAILASEPLPLPTDQAAISAFRDLNLKFRPNDN